MSALPRDFRFFFFFNLLSLFFCFLNYLLSLLGMGTFGFTL